MGFIFGPVFVPIWWGRYDPGFGRTASAGGGTPSIPVSTGKGGGMSLQRIPELLEFYGNEVILLVGGDLLRNGAEIENEDLARANARINVEQILGDDVYAALARRIPGSLVSSTYQ